jgi:Trypsin-like peptidase domain
LRATVIEQVTTTTKLRYLIAFLTYPIVVASGAMAASIPPDLKKAITFLFLANDKGGLAHDPQTQAPEANGTGFFVGVPSEKDPSRVFCYLVTAKHVIEDSSGTFFQRIYLRLNKKAGDVDFPSVDLTRDGHSAVVVSPDPTVDIAVVQVAPNETTYDFKMIPAAMLTTEESVKELHIGEGTDVFFAGLFVTYYGEHRNNPIVRFGRVAMFPQDRVSWKDSPTKPSEEDQLYLLETQSYGGNSGAPVFFIVPPPEIPPGRLLMSGSGQQNIMLAGVMKGYFNENSKIGFFQTPTTVIPYSSQNNGIAAVVPSFLLHDILFSPELTKARANYVEPAK